MIIAITNQKGGVGKTTVSINLSAALAIQGFRVLIVDMDPQGNSTDGLGINTDELDQTIYDTLINATPMNEIIVPHTLDNLFVAPANMSLFGAEAELSTEISRPFKLREALKAEKHKYDFIIIDCPPNLGVLTVNAIFACSDIVVPIEPNSYALKGMSVLMNTILIIRNDLDYYPNFLGVVVNMLVPKNELHQSILRTVVEHFPSEKMFQTHIHRSDLIPEAEIKGKSILEYSTINHASRAFMNLAKEIVIKQNERKEKRQTSATR